MTKFAVRSAKISAIHLCMASLRRSARTQAIRDMLNSTSEDPNKNEHEVKTDDGSGTMQQLSKKKGSGLKRSNDSLQ